MLKLNLSLALAIINRKGLEDSVYVDFSEVHYIPGIVGMSYNDNGEYIVYEVQENNELFITCSTRNEEEACVALLQSVGIDFSKSV